MKKIKMLLASLIFVLGLIGMPYDAYSFEDLDEDTTRERIEEDEDKPWYEELWDWIFE